MHLDFRRTERGFLRADFMDRYGEKCSIQESSLAEENAIWLGCDKGLHHHVTGTCLARMHLTRPQVAALLPALTHFVATGELPGESGIGDVLAGHISLLAHAAEGGANAEIPPSDALEVAGQLTDLRTELAETRSALAALHGACTSNDIAACTAAMEQAKRVLSPTVDPTSLGAR